MNRKNEKTGKRKRQKAAKKRSWEGYRNERMQTNRNYKDSLFRMLFGNKEALLSLYNALNHTNYQDSEELEITTIEDIIYMGFKNDASFLIGIDTMNLYETQSTRNPNMPIRGVSYFGHLYQAYVKKKNLNLYGKKQIKLPTPRYMVLYTGPEEEPDIQEYRLSSAFSDKESACLECIATVLNVNIGHNLEILEQCRLLYEYSYFLQAVRKCAQDSEGNRQMRLTRQFVCV